MSMHTEKMHPGQIRVPYKFTPCQKEFLKHPAKFKVMAKGRRFGATMCEAKHLIKCMLKYPESRSLWVDVTHGRIARYVARFFIPTLMKMPKQVKWEYLSSLKQLTVNGALLDFVSADRPENIEGLGYGFGGGIVVNEAGIVLKDRDLWNVSLLPMMMDGNAWVHFVGTPKGRHDPDGADTLFYAQFQKGENPVDFPNWKSFRYTTYDNIKPDGYLDKDIVDEVVAEQPVEIRPQEIYGEFINIKQGQVFRESWFETVDSAPAENNILMKVMSLDTAFKTKEESDYSVCLVVYQTRENYYIADCICDRFDFPELIKETERLYGEYKADSVLIEDRASGQSLIQTLKGYGTYPVLGINPDKDKVTRARAITPICQAGKVKLVKGAWNRRFLMQVAGFPCGHDDIVDALSQVLTWFKDSSQPVSKNEYVREKLDYTPNYMQGF